MPKNPKFKWTVQNYIDIFILARQGLSDGQIAKAVGVGISTWKSRLKNDYDLGETLTKGRAKRDISDAFFRRMPTRCQELWQEIASGETLQGETSTVKKRDQQFLFIYALLSSNFL